MDSDVAVGAERDAGIVASSGSSAVSVVGLCRGRSEAPLAGLGHHIRDPRFVNLADGFGDHTSTPTSKSSIELDLCPSGCPTHLGVILTSGDFLGPDGGYPLTSL